MGLEPWRHKYSKYKYSMAYTMQRRNYTGPARDGFHVWSDDTMFCAKPKAYGTEEWQVDKSVSRETSPVLTMWVGRPPRYTHCK